MASPDAGKREDQGRLPRIAGEPPAQFLSVRESRAYRIHLQRWQPDTRLVAFDGFAALAWPLVPRSSH
jgi:hypothetical protein